MQIMQLYINKEKKMIDRKKRAKEINSIWGKNNQVPKYREKITQNILSEKMDIDQGHLSRVLNGSTNVYLHTLVEMSDILNCKPADLLPLEWQSNNQSVQNSYAFDDESKAYLKEVMINVKSLIKSSKKNLTANDEADLIIGLFEATNGLSDEEKKAKLEFIVNFFLSTKSISKEAM